MKSHWQLIAVLLVAAAACAAHAAPYKFIKVADEDTASPDGPKFNSFNGFLSISDGTAAFSPNWSNLTKRGVFTGNGGPLTMITQIDSATSGSAAVVRDVEIRDGLTAFVFDHPLNDAALFTGNGGPLTTIAKLGDPAPLGTFDFFFGPSISHGTTAFGATYNNNTRSGVFTGNGGPLTTIVKSGDPAPIGEFDRFVNVAFDDGRFAFLASYDDLAKRGVFAKDGNTLTTIAKTGDAAPQGVFSDFGSELAISGNSVAFLGLYNNSQANAIFRGDGTHLETIAKKGDAAPVGVFDEFGYPFMNADTIAFLAAYDNYNSVGIFTFKDGTLTEVISQGDTLFGEPLSVLPVLDGQSIDIDEQGNIAFLYRMSGGRQGVAIATPIPEPTTVLLSVALVMTLAVSIRRAR